MSLRVTFPSVSPFAGVKTAPTRAATTPRFGTQPSERPRRILVVEPTEDIRTLMDAIIAPQRSGLSAVFVRGQKEALRTLHQEGPNAFGLIFVNTTLAESGRQGTEVTGVHGGTLIQALQEQGVPLGNIIGMGTMQPPGWTPVLLTDSEGKKLPKLPALGLKDLYFVEKGGKYFNGVTAALNLFYPKTAAPQAS